jgi:hypothetical protein
MDDYNKLKFTELRSIAKNRGLKGYSKFSKSELVQFLKSNDEPQKNITRSPKNKILTASTVKINLPPVHKKVESPHKLKGPQQKLSKQEIKSIFKITSSLAFIYQITNPANKEFIPPGFTTPDFIFSYEDAIECSKDIHSPKWKIVEKYIDLLVKDIKKYELEGSNVTIDKKLILNIMKKEASELQKGNVTFLHQKATEYLVLDIISKLVSGSSEGFKPKCLRKDQDKDKTALEIIKILFEIPNVKENIDLADAQSEIRSRVISTNNTLFNNAFNIGESTLSFLYQGASSSVVFPFQFVNDLEMNTNMKKMIKEWMRQISMLGSKLLVMYSIPIEYLDKYVYPSVKYGKIHSNENIYLNFKEYLSKEPWKKYFLYHYEKQSRIVDLCYTKYAKKDGVSIYRFTDISKDNLEKFMKKINQNLTKEIRDWFLNYIDL